MVTKVKINDNKRAPLGYLNDLKNFRSGTEYVFKPGVNIIVGENGCGKTTLLNILKLYLVVGYNECERGKFNSNINSIASFHKIDGIDVYADYDKNTFRLSHAGERQKHDAIERFDDFGMTYMQAKSSTGESVNIAINRLLKLMFSQDVNLKFDYDQFKDNYPEFHKYILEHREKDCPNEFTILMDEPDRNLSLENLKEIKEILSFHKENTQIIAVIHNPLLIASLSKIPDINFIEMTEGYVKKIKDAIREMLED